MKKIAEKLIKLSLPAAIIMSSLILGGFFYKSQLNKQESIERQQEIELEAKKDAEQAKVEEEQAKKAALESCLIRADILYWNYMDSNRAEDEVGIYNGGIWAERSVWASAEKGKLKIEDNCYKQYK